ncbi:MAG: M23 family metallopeptidase [Candidatus Pacebacteria bacterium]|nr:M23 family metallopeptidase [Candidatus Paceibacterota bacterium]
MGRTTLKGAVGIRGANTVKFHADGDGTLTEITDKDGGKVFEIEHKCDSGHGGEAVTTTVIPDTEKHPDGCKCDNCFELYERAGDKAVGWWKDGFEHGKGCGPQCNCKEGRAHGQVSPPSKEPSRDWVKFLVIGAGVILVLLILWWAYNIYVDNTDTASKEETHISVTEKENSASDEGEDGDGQQEEVEDDSSTETETDPEPTADVTAPTSFGMWNVASPNIMVTVYDCLTEDKANFRKYAGDKLDGVDKFDLMSSIIATYVVTGKNVVYDDRGRPKLIDTGPILDTCEFVQDFAYRAGNRTLYKNPRVDKDSLNWWANSSFQKVPSSKATDFSNATRSAIINLNQGLEDLGEEDGLNGVIRAKYELPTIVAVSSKTGGAKSTSGKKKVASGSSKLSVVEVDVNPLPNGYTFMRGVSLKGDVHHGYDLATPCDNPILAAKGGKVVKVAVSESYGNLIAIDDGVYVWQYAHMQLMTNKDHGSKVKAGEQIGFVGNTGHVERSKGGTGCHLHMECWTRKEWNKKEQEKKATPNKVKLTAEVLGPRPFAFQKKQKPLKRVDFVSVRVRSGPHLGPTE